MQNITAQREMEIIRYKFRTNNRLNLEFRSALSKLFRDYKQPVDDEILSRVTLALPDELVGIASSLQSSISARARKGGKGGYSPPKTPGIPPQGGNIPPQGGNIPPQGGSIPPQGGSIPPQGGPSKRPGKKSPAKKRPSKKRPSKRQQPGAIPPQGASKGTGKGRKGRKGVSKKGGSKK